ncbi:MAG TPA: tetratricopeptide repeat protein [Polyangia bacterium]
MPPLPPETLARFFVRRLDGRVTGPHEKAAIMAMLASAELQGTEEIAIDRRTWKPLSLLVGHAPAASPAAPPPRLPRASLDAGPSAGGGSDFIDLPALDAPVDLGMAGRGPSLDLDAPRPSKSGSGPARATSLDQEREPAAAAERSRAPLSLAAPGGPRVSLDSKPAEAPRARPEARPEAGPAAAGGGSKGVAALTSMFEQRRTASRGIPVVTDLGSPATLPNLDAPELPVTDDAPEEAPGAGVDLGLSLELVERKPAPKAPPPGPRPPTPEASSPLAPPPGRDRAAARPNGPSLTMRGAGLSTAEIQAAGAARIATSNIAAAGPPAPSEASASETDAEVLAEPPPPAARPRTRVRTVTAARPGAVAGADQRRRPGRRVLAIGGAVGIAAALAGAAVVFELPSRLRPEPSLADVLGPEAAGIAEDRFPAFSEGARRLEDAVATRKRAPVTRAEAAMLLAASVVVHGGERGRLARAEALLPPPESGEARTGKAAAAVARARAFIALGKGRGKDAEASAADAPLTEGDRAFIKGSSALARQDFAGAARSFAAAEASVPPPAPSKIAARFALGLAREGALMPGAAETYRSVLAEVPAHFGASLGLLRSTAATTKPAARRKTAETLLALHGRDASPAERGEAHVRVAEAAFEMGDRAGGEAALGRARGADPAGVALAVALGDRALAEGRLNEALAFYKPALSPTPATARTAAWHFARVGAFLAAGRTAEATTALEMLDKALPKDARVPFWRAQVAERTKASELSVAEAFYQEALTRDPKLFPASLDLARLCLGRHRTQEALAVLKRAEAQGTAPVALRMALGEALLAAGNGAEAVRAFKQAQSDDPKNLAAKVGLATALQAAGDADGASRELGALAALPETAQFGARLGELFVKLGRRPEALAAYQREIATGAAAPAAKVAAARLALELGDTDTAQKLAQAAVDDDPRTSGALFVLAEVLRAKGDLARAVSELRRAQAVDGAPEIQLEYGRILASMGRDDEAMTALAEAREIPEAAVERGRIDLRRGNLDRAVQELTAATAKLPAHAEAFLLLGQAEDRLGQIDKAEAAYRTSARLSPGLGEVRYRLGRLLFDRGTVAAALPHLRAAAEHVPAAASWRADLYFQLGFAEQRQGGRDRAAAAFRRYLELAPADAPARAEVLKQLQN